MCGIVGLFLKDTKLEPQLGALLEGMLVTMCERGPDSAGFAIYGSETAGALKLTVRCAASTDQAALVRGVSKAIGADVKPVHHDTHCVLTISDGKEAAAREALSDIAPEATIVGAGRRMEVYKEVGRPDAVAERFELGRMQGTHA